MSSSERQQRANAADASCAAAFARAVQEYDAGAGVALVAVGGYGRRELAPFSDLDIVLVHDDDVDVSELAGRVWYPLWDTGARLDHSVRAMSEVTKTARDDVRVAVGMLDTRHLAGDQTLTLRLRSALLTQWRRDARTRVPELAEMVRSRGRLLGELAHAAVPDLKESIGGLRDATVLKGLVAAWLVDVPHVELERSRQRLLDVRDALHTVLGRRSDRVAPETWQDMAPLLDVESAEDVQVLTRRLGRRITHLSRLTWRRVDEVLARPVSPVGPRRPSLAPVAPGVAVSSGEVVLDRGADPARDPLLLLRAAAEAAERGLILAPPTAARLARDSASLPEPWPTEARVLLTRLLASGPGLLPVWETLDEVDALVRLLPEWSRVQLLPHASVVHRFTVDRHLVETCMEAARLIRRVARADVLVVAALLHDIGKGGTRDHSVAGEPLARRIAQRMGFDEREVTLVTRLVRWHLLLPDVATTRDIEDPSTAALVADRVEDAETLDLLEVLTEADARATSPKAWSTWRSQLVRELVSAVRAELHRRGPVPTPVATAPTPPETALALTELVAQDPSRVEVVVDADEHGSRVTVVTGDRPGVLAAVAAALAVRKTSVRTARAWSEDDVAMSVWQVDDPDVDRATLRQRLQAALDGTLDVSGRLSPADASGPSPVVTVHPDASDTATVLEVRAADRPGVVYHVCRALAALELSVRSAHVDTLGPQAVDVFYVQETGAGALADDRAAEAAHAVRRALGDPVTLDPVSALP